MFTRKFCLLTRLAIYQCCTTMPLHIMFCMNQAQLMQQTIFSLYTILYLLVLFWQLTCLLRDPILEDTGILASDCVGTTIDNGLCNSSWAEWRSEPGLLSWVSPPFSCFLRFSDACCVSKARPGWIPLENWLLGNRLVVSVSSNPWSSKKKWKSSQCFKPLKEVFTSVTIYLLPETWKQWI